LELLSSELLENEGWAPRSASGDDPGIFLCEVLPLDLERVFFEMFVLVEDTEVETDTVESELLGTLNSMAAMIHSHGG